MKVSVLAADIFQIFQRHHYTAQRAEKDMELAETLKWPNILTRTEI